MEMALEDILELVVGHAAVRQIVELCMTANDVKTARPLLRAIQNASIREDVLKIHPTLQE